MPEYDNKSIKDLAKQLLLNPAPVRRKHADRIEAFLLDLDTERAYASEFVYYRITGFRPSELPVDSIDGQQLYGDLQKMLEEVSSSCPIPVEEVPEAVYSVENVASKYGVSERTVYRWRDKGLITRKYRFPHGRERMGVRDEALNRFISDNEALVDQSRKFTVLSEDEKKRIISRYQKMQSGRDLSATALAKKVAEEVDRAPETIRRVISESPDQLEANGRSQKRSLSLNDKKQIYRQYSDGESVQHLAQHYDRSRQSIYRIINQERARELIRKVSLLPDDRAPEIDTVGNRSRMFETDGDAASDEDLVRLYHYLKDRVREMADELDPARYVSSASLDALGSRLAVIQKVRRKLLMQSLPTIFETAQQHRGPEVGLADLVDEGCVWVVLSIEQFNHRKPGKFVRFVRLELMKHFARTIPSTNYQGTSDSRNTTPSRAGTEELEQAMILAARRVEGFETENITDETLREEAHHFGLFQPNLQDVLESLAEDLGWEGFEYDLILQRLSGIRGEVREGQC
ncbi:MAG: hypothetical protein ACOC0A_00600 [Planctomycetota bacterium]